MTHRRVSKLTIIGSDNGLSPGRRQAIIWINAGILLIRTLGTNFSEILSEILAFSFKKCIRRCRLRNGVHLSRPQWVNAIVSAGNIFKAVTLFGYCPDLEREALRELPRICLKIYLGCRVHYLFQSVCSTVIHLLEMVALYQNKKRNITVIILS